MVNEKYIEKVEVLINGKTLLIIIALVNRNKNNRSAKKKKYGIIL